MTKIKVTNVIKCPLLSDEGLCTVYETRFSCCRNFPNKNEGMFCSDKKCVFDANGNIDCMNCKDKCCNYLAMDVFDTKLLDMSCEECKETYCS